MRLLLTNLICILLLMNSALADEPLIKEKSKALTVGHNPNPADGHFLKDSNSYKWYYETEVKNNLDIPLRIVRFGFYSKEDDQWVLRNFNNRIFTGADFAKWYTAADSIVDGWILPDKTAKVARNWNSWSNSIPPSVKWKYTAVDSAGNEYQSEALIELNPAPVPFLNGAIIFPRHYRYQAGDDIAWAQPGLDDHLWERRTNPSPYPDGSRGQIRWTRLVLEVDSALWNVPIGISVWSQGAAEFYLDGKLLHRFGKIGTSQEGEKALMSVNYPRPRAITFRPLPGIDIATSRHVIAIRHSSFFLESPIWAGVEPGFSFNMGDLDKMSDEYAHKIRRATFHQMFLMGMFLAFALSHFLLYMFYPKLRANLYFAALAALTCLFAFFTFQNRFFITEEASALWDVRLGNTVVGLLLLSLLRFTYALIYSKVPRMFIVFVLVALSLILLNWFMPFQIDSYGILVASIFLAEIARTIIVTRIKKRNLLFEGSWIILLGMVVVVLATGYHILVFDLEILPRLWDFIDFPTPFYAALILMISMSVFLSRNFAQINNTLEAKLVEVKELSEKTLKQELERAALAAENARKINELEEARQLQLSMLPKSIPKLPNFEIAVYMQPATEVGGDYYDFILEEDGTMTAVIGDATGHGLKAGTMVATTKGLFNSLVHETDLLQILKKSSSAIKAVGFHRMYMAMTIARFKDNQMQIVGAGMPYALLYRTKTNQVLEVELKGMPLGSFPDFPYQQKELILNDGDTLLMMSDGLPEMFNEQQEILGYDETKLLFAGLARKSPNQIIQHLRKAGERWANGSERADDVTLVVIKYTM